MELTLHRSSVPPDADEEPKVIGREWKSAFSIGGFPLVHVTVGRNADGKSLVAKGVVAIGQFATGGVCISQFGIGLISISQFAISVVSVSQFALAAIAVAQIGFCLEGIGGASLFRLLPFLNS